MILILAPNSFERFIVAADSQFQLLTKAGPPASLINIDRVLRSHASGLEPGFTRVNPMAGYYLESFLKMRGYDAKAIFDWDNDNALKKAMDLKPEAILFSTTFITGDELLANCLESVRAITGDVPIIVGGPYIWKQKIELNTRDGECNGNGHTTARHIQLSGDDEPNPLARFGIKTGNYFTNCKHPATRDAIYVASEYGEYSLEKLLASLKQGKDSIEDLAKLPNLILPHPKGGWVVTADEIEPVDLNVDFTRWDLIEDVPKMIPLRTSVGCPFKCRYCDFIELHPKVVMRSPDSLAEEIRLAKDLGKHVFNFVDDNIFLSKPRIKQLTSTLLDNKININWGGFFRSDRVDDSNIDDLRASGCRFGSCGIESADERMLKLMRKGCKSDEMTRGIELATSVGIHLTLSFIIGFPGENQESVDNTVAFMNNLKTNTNPSFASYQVYPFYLMPGTAADRPDFRAEHEVTGRHVHWAHKTMNYHEAANVWAPYVFKKVDALPYDYYTNDVPFNWDVDARVKGFDARRKLTVAFMDDESDAEIQSKFSDLCEVYDPKKESPTPQWTEVLAPKDKQPGSRKPTAEDWGPERQWAS